MNRQAVESSNLKSVGYDAATLELEVEFGNGTVWRYRGVTADVWAKFQAAESKGRFFATEIRGKYTDAVRVPAESGAQ